MIARCKHIFCGALGEGACVILPASGWHCVGTNDRGERDGTCDWCGTSLRYEHRLTHPTRSGELVAGCVCAGWLTGDPAGARAAERALISEAGKARRHERNRQMWLAIGRRPVGGES